MGKTSKFVYVLILFISFFLVIVLSACPSVRYFEQDCVTDKDCPKITRHNIRCRKGRCAQV